MNTRKILSVILSLVMILTALPLTAVNSFAETSGDWIYHILDDGTAKITAYTGSATNLVIPSTLDEYAVTSIGDYAFYNCTSLTSVTIPDSVTSIGYWAFFQCTSLESIIIPDSVTYIGKDAFYNTAYYNNSDNWENGVLYIGHHLIKANSDDLASEYKIKAGTLAIADEAFENCTSLASVEIPDSVTSIGEYAFRYCESLTSINANEANENYCSVNGVLFNKDKTELICYPAGKTDISYTIPDSVTNIGSGAFCDCVSLTSVIIPDSVTYIGKDAFYNTAYYKNLDNWNDGVLYIGKFLIDIETISEYDEELGGPIITSSVPAEYRVKDGTVGICGFAFACVFRACPKLETLIIPDSVIYIGERAFFDCEALTSVVFGKNIEIIEKEAFYDCISLTNVTIPESVTSIGEYAFGYNWNYETYEYEKIEGFTIYGYEGTEAERYANDNGFTFIALEKEPIVEPTPDDPTPNPNPDEPTPNPNPDIIPADLNGDSKITVVDAKWTLQAVAGSRTLTAEQITAADVNGDGKVTVVDAKWILQAVAGMRDLAI